MLASVTSGLGCGDTTVTVSTSSTGAGGSSSNSATTTTASGGGAPQSLRVLLFSEAEGDGFVHDSRETAVAALQQVGKTRGWTVSHTDDSNPWFNDAKLATVDVVAWIMTAGDPLTVPEQEAFERFIQAGGGFVGLHSASSTHYEWPWYDGLLGSHFFKHPSVQEGTIRVERTSHLATAHLPPLWSRVDEWYTHQANPRDHVNILLSLDEAVGGKLNNQPLAWYQRFDGGRSFYSALGHRKEAYQEPLLIEHIAGGIEWAGGRQWPKLAIVDLDGVADSGTWLPQQSPPFTYEVTPHGLVMHDESDAHQHLVRSGSAIDPTRQYVVEALVRIAGPLGGVSNSFALHLNVAGPDGDTGPLNTWAINLDLSNTPPGAVMKHIGWVDGTSVAMGERVVGWGEPDREYLLRVAINSTLDGSRIDGVIAVTVMHNEDVKDEFVVDYNALPYQPDKTKPVRIGVSGHGANWTMRSLRVYYLD